MLPCTAAPANKRKRARGREARTAVLLSRPRLRRSDAATTRLAPDPECSPLSRDRRGLDPPAAAAGSSCLPCVVHAAAEMQPRRRLSPADTADPGQDKPRSRASSYTGLTALAALLRYVRRRKDQKVRHAARAWDRELVRTCVSPGPTSADGETLGDTAIAAEGKTKLQAAQAGVACARRASLWLALADAWPGPRPTHASLARSHHSRRIIRQRLRSCRVDPVASPAWHCPLSLQSLSLLASHRTHPSPLPLPLPSSSSLLLFHLPLSWLFLVLLLSTHTYHGQHRPATQTPPVHTAPRHRRETRTTDVQHCTIPTVPSKRKRVLVHPHCAL